MFPTLRTGALYAAGGLLLQLGLLRLLSFVPAGARGQGAGVAIATLVMLAMGLLLGQRARRVRPALSAEGLEALRSPWQAAPWGEVTAAALSLGLVGLLAYFTGALDALNPAGVGGITSAGVGGVSRALWAADALVIPSLGFTGLGAMLGVNARPFTFRAAGLGFISFLGLSAAMIALARVSAYDSFWVVSLALLGVATAALLNGFLLAWLRGRLAFVESTLIAVAGGYTVFFLALSVEPSWTLAVSLPEEQIFLSLSVMPTVAFCALMMVGGSVGFLLNGGRRFDPGFGLELQVALRYLRAHGRRRSLGIVTVIAVLGVCLGVMALIIVLSIMSGFEADLKKTILGAHAHIVINKRGDFTEYAEVERRVRQVPGAGSAAAFVLGDAMASTPSGLSGVIVKGVEMTDPVAVADLKKILTNGKLSYLDHPDQIPGVRPKLDLPPPTRTATTGAVEAVGAAHELLQPAVRGRRRVLPGVILGRELSYLLRAYVGDTVRLVSPISDDIGPMGPIPRLRRFRVAAVFYSGMYEYDAKFVYIQMPRAQRFFGQPKRATGVEIKVTDVDNTAVVKAALRRTLADDRYVIKDWRQMNRELFSALLLEKLAMFIVLGMIVMVASFLIVAVLVMIVLQRKKEIAILKSVGASDASIMKIFVIQGLILGVGGALLGGLSGIGVCLLIDRFAKGLDPSRFFIDRLPVVMDWAEISVIIGSAVIISYLATIYPAMTAALHPPVEGLRDD